MKTYRVKDMLDGSIWEWTLVKILEEINRDRSNEWTDYDKSNWRDGLKEWTNFELLN